MKIKAGLWQKNTPLAYLLIVIKVLINNTAMYNKFGNYPLE